MFSQLKSIEVFLEHIFQNAWATFTNVLMLAVQRGTGSFPEFPF